MNIQDIQLDINKSPSVGKWVTIGQGDKGGTTIRATVYDNGAAAELAGMSARFEMRMPNATYFEDTNCTVSGNVITYVVDESHAALYAGGGSEAYFALHDGDTAIYSTERFHVRVARAASDGANPGRAWTNGIEEWLEDASDELDGYVASADARVGATINAANAAVEGMRSDVDGAIDDTEDVIGRVESAIDAMGDISELAVPLMSADVRGGARLEEHGGLVLRDEKLGIGSLVQESDGAVRGGIAELTAKGHAEQASTTGKNLLPPLSPNTQNGITLTVGADGTLTFNGTASATTSFQAQMNVAAGTYTLSANNEVGIGSSTSDSPYMFIANSDDQWANSLVMRGANSGSVATTQSNLVRYGVVIPSGVTLLNFKLRPQLEAGSTATEYEPYTGAAPSPSPEFPQDIVTVTGHTITGKTGRFVDLVVKQGNTTLSTTPIPLPSRGWVAGLPDGTADSLRLDGAGHVEWTLPTSEVTFDGSSDEGWKQQDVYTNNARYSFVTDAAFNKSNGGQLLCSHLSEGNAGSDSVNIDLHGSQRMIQMTVPYLALADFKTWLSTHPVTVLYPLATPVTEDCGYVEDWQTDLPEGAVIDIPELSEVGIKFFIDSSVTELAKQWYAKARNEYEDRLEALESAVAELVTGA